MAFSRPKNSVSKAADEAATRGEAANRNEFANRGSEDAVKANVYADSSFAFYINGELVPVDSIKLIPHSVVSVDYKPRLT